MICHSKSLLFLPALAGKCRMKNQNTAFRIQISNYDPYYAELKAARIEVIWNHSKNI